MISDTQLRTLLQIADDEIDWNDDHDVVQWTKAIRNARLLLSVLEDDDVTIHADKIGGIILDMGVDSISEIVSTMKGEDPVNGIMFYGSYTAKRFIQEYILK